MPLDPPAVPTTTGRVDGAAALGGGSGELWIDERLETEPVTSLLFGETWACGRKILSDSKRCVSELQLTAATETVARMATRNKRSERPGSTTRIGFPTRTQQDE